MEGMEEELCVDKANPIATAAIADEQNIYFRRIISITTYQTVMAINDHH